MMREMGASALAKAEMARAVLVIPQKNPNEVSARGGLDNVSPSPMTLFSTLLADNGRFADSKPFSSSRAGTLASPTFFPASGGELTLHNIGTSVDMLACSANSTREAIANAQEHRLSSFRAKYRSMMPSKLPIAATSTYLTIPPGLSPTTLLDSPVLFNAELVDPSPTTGSLYNTSKTEGTHFSTSIDVVKDKDITFKQPGCYGSLHRPVNRSVEPEIVAGLPDDASLPASVLTVESTSGQALGFLRNGSDFQKSSESAALIMRPFELVSNVQISDLAPQCISERTTVDGYNWKKYGQKQLKGTEFPRSYYKCTHPNCPVKKQVECSHEGEITEILYKGEHNHAKPQALRRGARNGGQSFLHENNTEVSSCAVPCKAESDRFSTDLSSSSLVGGLAGTPEQSFCSPSMEEREDVEQDKTENNGEDEQDSKRRRTENLKERLSSAPVRTIREPRVVVQTTSEVDILDDGYRWRKYGQKVVKGNRFPRSYYKCTNIGCIVRKHVERSSTDPTSVMTAYEGKHNHNVPAARGSVREITGATAGPPPFASYAAMGLSKPSMLYETQRELSSLVDNNFNAGNQFNITMTSPLVSNIDRNNADLLVSSKTAGRSMGFDPSVMRNFGLGEKHGQDLGSNFSQPIYPSSSSSCVAEGHLSRL